MTAAETVDALLTWTPYLAAGFGWNMIVSLAAMAVGTLVGVPLALLRGGSARGVKGTGSMLTTLARSAPTFVMLFYLAYVIPGSFEVLGVAVAVPAWFKASLALAIAVAGYVSDNALAALRHLRRGETAEALLFLPSWTSYFLIIVMASATASVIGVPELVHRAQTVIGAIDRPGFSFWIYLYAMIWFLAFAGIVALAMRALRAHLGGASGSISRHLILIVSASVGVAILAVAVAMGLLARNALIDQAENQARLVAGLIAGEANRADAITDEIARLVTRENEAQAIAVGHLSEAVGGDAEALAVHLAEITADSAIDDVWIVDETGAPATRVLDGLGRVDAGAALDEIDGPVLQSLLSGRRFSAAFWPPPRDGMERPMRYAGVRARSGEVVVVGASADEAAGLRGTFGLAAALGSLAGQPGIRAIWVVDDSLEVSAAVATGARAAPESAFMAVDRTLADRALDMGVQSVLGDNALHVAAPILDRGVATGVAVIHMPRDQLDRLLADYLWFGLLIAAAAFLIGSATAILSARRITRPVMALTHAAEEMDRRTFVPESLDRVGRRRDELGRLIRVFQTMARDVLAREEHLEALVAERTRDLEEKNAQLDRAKRRMEDELAIAHSLQGAILPKTLPQHGAYSGDALMTPAREMGGDFYDFFVLPDGRFGVVIADVSGKGVSAAFFMAITRTVMRAAAHDVDRAGACLRLVNDEICAQNPHDLFVTLFYGILDPATGRFVYANAGHNTPFLVRGSGEIEMLPLTGGVAVGVMPGLTYNEDDVTLAAGDTLFLYTDGISEAMNGGGETFDEARLQAALTTADRASVGDVIEDVTLAVAEFVGQADQSDDITCLVLRYNGDSS